jgi:hypothetical protein
MSEQSITKTVKSVLSSDTDLNQKVRSNNWVTIGLAATGALLVTLSATTRHKFQYAQVCISANCDDDQQGYLLIQSVYDSERAINPNSFGRKTEQIGYIPGVGWILYLEAILGTSLIGAAYSYHSGFTKTLLLNRLTRYAKARLLALQTDSSVSAYLEIGEHNRLLEKQMSVDRRNAEDLEERALAFSPEQIKEMQTDVQRAKQLGNLDHELKVAKYQHDIQKVQTATGKEPKITKATLPTIAGITWFNFDWFETKSYDEIPHIRFIGSTGVGKTLLGNLVLDKLPGDSVVWTIKRKPHQWQGKAVIGVPEDFERLEIEFQKLQAERKERLSDVESGLEPDIINVAIDEWRAIKNRIGCAVDVVRDTLTLAREARQRLLLFAQGRQVKTFGLTDESDLEECMVSIYMGAFAREEAEAYYSKAKHIEEDSKAKVIAELEKAGSRALWIHSGFGNYPGLAPTIEI